jgi:hypothetical protein
MDGWWGRKGRKGKERLAQVIIARREQLTV